MQPIVEVDFETEAIDPFDYPPKPVGVAVEFPNGESDYWAWGHPEGNNIDEDAARERLRSIARNHRLSFFHSYFDVSVGRRWGCWEWPVHGFEDGLPQVFLDDPRAKSLGLKETAERVLNIPPTERDAVRDWLLDHGFRAKTKKGLGAFIAKAPGGLVGDYARQDVRLDRRVREYFYPRIVEAGMREAYERELALTPVLIKMTEKGIAVDVERLSADIKDWQLMLDAIDNWVRRQLFVGPSVNLDSDAELADALEVAGKIRLNEQGKPMWLLTETGNRSVSADSLKVSVTDPELHLALERRGILQTCINTFGLNWLKMAGRDGRIHTQWNATRDHQTGKGRGASTSRISSSPNLQNIFKNLPSKKSFRPELPNLRSYLIPTPGYSLFSRDYSGQELRITAHYEDGPMLQAYIDNPRIDIHQMVSDIVTTKYRIPLDRDGAKTMIFGILYGMGSGLAASRLGVALDTAKKIREAILSIFPGVRDLQKQLRQRAARNEPARTLGGRLYYCKEPKVFKDKKTGRERLVTFEYKMLNDLIQPSGADMTKQASIWADEAGVELMLSVHDELICEASTDDMPPAMKRLKDAMEAFPLDCPLLSDGKWSDKSWGEMETYNDAA